MWIDVTRPITARLPVWPGDPPPQIEPVATVARDGYAVHRLVMSSHAGTHLDAPCHFFEGASGVDKIALDTLIGPCRVVESLVGVSPAGQRLLFKTSAALSIDMACHLQSALLVGVDSLSVDDLASTSFPVHRQLLAAGVVILEGLDLSSVNVGTYTMIALPLRLPGLDGSPCRVVLQPL